MPKIRIAQNKVVFLKSFVNFSLFLVVSMSILTPHPKILRGGVGGKEEEQQ